MKTILRVVISGTLRESAAIARTIRAIPGVAKVNAEVQFNSDLGRRAALAELTALSEELGLYEAEEA